MARVAITTAAAISVNATGHDQLKEQSTSYLPLTAGAAIWPIFKHVHTLSVAFLIVFDICTQSFFKLQCCNFCNKKDEDSTGGTWSETYTHHCSFLYKIGDELFFLLVFFLNTPTGSASGPVFPGKAGRRQGLCTKERETNASTQAVKYVAFNA